MPNYNPALAGANTGQSTMLDRFRGGNRLRRPAAILAGVGAILIPVSQAGAQTGPETPSNVAGLYTSLTPDQLTQDIQGELSPGTQGAEEFVLSPSVFSVRSADGTSESTPAATGYQTKLNQVGNRIISSIPNVSIGRTQTVQSVQRTPEGAIDAAYVCPAPSSNPAAISFASIKVQPGNKVNAQLCPSDKEIKFSTLDWSDKVTLQALERFKSDPLRSGEPWAGDKYDRDPWQLCPQTPEKQDPQARVKLAADKKSGTVTIGSVGTGPYCEYMGQDSSEVSLEAKRPGSKKYVKVGDSVLHVAGIPDILLSQYDGPMKYARKKEVISGLGNLCAGKTKSHTLVRARTVVRFVANPHQTFRHNYRGGSDLMKSSKATFVSTAQKACA